MGVSRSGLSVLLVTLLCLLGACSHDDKEQPAAPKATPVAPSDIFTRRAPPGQQDKKVSERKVLVVGDSLSISLGEQLERALSGAPGIDFTRDGTRSSGLTRPELVNWPEHLRELVDRLAPDLVVIMIGANDAMPLQTGDGGHIYFDNPEWPAAYAAKARELVDLCRKANPKAAVYWVGVPPMGESPLAKEIRQVNAALRTMCSPASGCRFIDTIGAFANQDGRFSRRAKDTASGDMVTIRTADGVHMTDIGAKLLAGVVVRALADREQLGGIAGVDELRAFARDIRPVADVVQSEPPKPSRRVAVSKHTYTVRRGDTFNIIAKRLGIDADDLATVNPGVDSRHLSLDQTLRLPAKKR